MIWQKLNNLTCRRQVNIKDCPQKSSASKSLGNLWCRSTRKATLSQRSLHRHRRKSQTPRASLRLGRKVCCSSTHQNSADNSRIRWSLAAPQRAASRQQQFCRLGVGGKDWLQLLSTEAGLAQGAEAWTFSATGSLLAPSAPAAGSKLQSDAAVTQMSPAGHGCRGLLYFGSHQAWPGPPSSDSPLPWDHTG